MPRSPRELLLDIYDAAVAGAEPTAATAGAIDELDLDGARATWIVAIGKAAHATATAAVHGLRTRSIEPAGGVIVAPEAAPSPHPRIELVVGDHPVPGARSLDAATRLGEVAARVGDDDVCLVLLSGGATSLVAAPVEGVELGDLHRLYQNLLGAGADIRTMNAVRKRFSRWGAGRLARALAPATVYCLVVSDVRGDDLASIGSGPCVPDPLSALELEALIERESLGAYVPQRLRAHLAEVEVGRASETPKPDDPSFARTSTRIILSNRDALHAAARRAHEVGIAPVKVVPEPLDDDAALTGARVAEELIRFHEAGLSGSETSGEYGCMIWGGETTVLLSPSARGRGGRCQELALAAACALHSAGSRGEGITLLAAGTDGRDGPTDAAGAITDHSTCAAAHRAGRDPERDLMEHDSYHALDAAGALVRVGLTGTNVQDVVVGVVVRRT